MCDKMSGLCRCERGFSGMQCQLSCKNKCNGHGRCFMAGHSTAECTCEAGFTGEACEKASRSSDAVAVNKESVSVENANVHLGFSGTTALPNKPAMEIAMATEDVKMASATAIRIQGASMQGRGALSVKLQRTWNVCMEIFCDAEFGGSACQESCHARRCGGWLML